MNKYKILDIGCGRGLNAKILAKKGSVYGIDIDEANVEVATRSCSQGVFIKAYAENIPYPDGYFNEIHCYDVLEYVNDLGRSLEEIDRLLKKDGILIVEVPNPESEKFLLKIRPTYWSEIHHVRYFEKKEFINLMKKNRFKFTKFKKLKSIENIQLALYFRFKKGIVNQNGSFGKYEKYVNVFFLLFSEDLFKYPLKYLFPIWPVTLFIGKVGNIFFPKTHHYEFRKES